MSLACILWDVWPFPWGMSPSLPHFASPGNMPHGNNYVPLNMHARDMVCISIDSHWQWQPSINQVSSMHIMGCMTVSMRHVLKLPEAVDWEWGPRCPVWFFEESGVFFRARDLIPSRDALYMSPTQPQIAPNFRFWWISSEIWRIYIFSRLWRRPYWKKSCNSKCIPIFSLLPFHFVFSRSQGSRKT